MPLCSCERVGQRCWLAILIGLTGVGLSLDLARKALGLAGLRGEAFDLIGTARWSGTDPDVFSMIR